MYLMYGACPAPAHVVVLLYIFNDECPLVGETSLNTE